MSFYESLVFPVDISYGSSGGPKYNTRVIRLVSGHEQRNKNWLYPLHEYDVQYGIKSRTDLVKVVEFFHLMDGMGSGFRYKDWLDYSSGEKGVFVTAFDDQVIGIGDGLNKTFQLQKVYAIGNVYKVRKIVKPVSGTVTVGVDGHKLTSDWSVDTATGIVTFVDAPATGKEVTAGFEFHVPVRFADDKLAVSIPDLEVASSQIKLEEIRI